MKKLLLFIILLLPSVSHAGVWDDVGNKLGAANQVEIDRKWSKPRGSDDPRSPNKKLFDGLAGQVIEARKNMRGICIPLFNVTPDITMNTASAQAAFNGAAQGANAMVRNAIQHYQMDDKLMPEFVVRAHLNAKASAEAQQAQAAVV